MKFFLKAIKAVLALLLAVWLLAFIMLRFESHQYTRLSESQLADAAAYLEGKLTAIPAGWKWHTFEPEPGVSLRTGVIDADNSKGTVIVVPGFSAPIEMSMRSIVQIHAAGYRVASIEYRGQGESWRPLANPEKGHVESFALLGSELAAFAKQIRTPGKPLFFFSTSKGAHITMRMAGDNDMDVAAYALVVPMIQVSTGAKDYAQMKRVAGAMKALGLGSMYAPGQTSWPTGELVFGQAIPCNANPHTAQVREALFAARESLRTNGVTIGWLAAAADSTDRLFQPDHLAAISQPVTMFTAGVDELVNTEAAQRFCNALPDCQYRHFPQARHCIMSEDFELYDGIIASAVAHFDAQLDIEPRILKLD